MMLLQNIQMTESVPAVRELAVTCSWTTVPTCRTIFCCLAGSCGLGDCDGDTRCVVVLLLATVGWLGRAAAAGLPVLQ